MIGLREVLGFLEGLGFTCGPSRGYDSKGFLGPTSSITVAYMYLLPKQRRLGGSWVVVISRAISRVTTAVTHIRGLRTPLITTHEPPSIDSITVVCMDLVGYIEPKQPLRRIRYGFPTRVLAASEELSGIAAPRPPLQGLGS